MFDLCFAPGREALSSYRLRDGVPPCRQLCLVARDADGILAGAIRYWPVVIDPAWIDPAEAGRDEAGRDEAGRDDAASGEAASVKAASGEGAPVSAAPWPALLLGPIAVHPTRQGEGLGGVLIRDSLALARALPDGGARVLLVGDAPYYSRFGFAPLAQVVMPPPTNPDRVLGLALAPGAWQGVHGQVRPARAGRTS